MKAGQIFALISGVFFLILGIMGFFPNLLQGPVVGSEVSDAYSIGYGMIFGVIPTNSIHNTIRVVAGLSGIVASISLDSTRVYCRAISAGYGLFAILGLIPYTDTFFGTVPIFGSDVLLHGLSAAIATYFGFFASPGLLEISDKPQVNS